jgi:hypothetical protein
MMRGPKGDPGGSVDRRAGHTRKGSSPMMRGPKHDQVLRAVLEAEASG